jgi:pimeloyl-ACP methyl ester carboxylesterase
MTTASNVILVHGPWADGSSWSKVIPLLPDGGLRVSAVQLPLISLKDDVATVKRAIALENGPMILVGHSYGGVVFTEAGNEPKVAGLVYIAAFAPDVGQSVGSLGASVEPAPMGAEVRPDAQGFLKLTEAGVKNDFCPRPQSDGKGRPVCRTGTDSGERFLGKTCRPRRGRRNRAGTWSPIRTARFSRALNERWRRRAR